MAPESAVLKLSGKKFDKAFRGPVSYCLPLCTLYLLMVVHSLSLLPHPLPPPLQAIVFDGEDAAYDAVMAGKVRSHDTTCSSRDETTPTILSRSKQGVSW